MANLHYLVETMLLINAIYAVYATSLGKCTDEHLQKIRNKEDTCPNWNALAKCLLLASNHYTQIKTEADIQAWEGYFKKTLSSTVPVDCNINITAIVKELQEEIKMGIKYTTAKPTGYENAKSYGDCTDSFAATVKPPLTCAHVNPFFKCIVRVFRLHHIPSDSAQQVRQKIHNIITTVLRNAKVECDINVAALMEQVQEEEMAEETSGSQEKKGNVSVLIVSFLTMLISARVSMVEFH